MLYIVHQGKNVTANSDLFNLFSPVSHSHTISEKKTHSADQLNDIPIDLRYVGEFI